MVIFYIHATGKDLNLMDMNKIILFKKNNINFIYCKNSYKEENLIVFILVQECQ